MNNVDLLHKPKWNLVGDEWHMIIGNKTVARIIPNEEENFPHIHWLSDIDYKKYNAYGWDAVDFETLDVAMYDIEHWWLYMCKGEKFTPALHCDNDCPYCNHDDDLAG